MSDDKELEAAVATYREQLRAEADLGKKELGEIEDHLRDLIADLRERGMPLADATREAALRLGDPKAIAREHARVRTPFGAKLPAWRAWVASAAIGVQLILFLAINRATPSAIPLLEVGIGVGLAVAMAMRLTWPRPILLATMIWQIAWGVFAWLAPHSGPIAWISPQMMVLSAIVVAMLVPWSRRELRAPGIALGLLYFAFLGSSWTLGFQLSHQWSGVPTPSMGQIGVGAVIVAGAGVVLRARWAGVAAAVACAAQVIGIYILSSVTWRFGDASDFMYRTAMVVVTGGAVCAAIAAVVAWRTARSPLGTLRDVLA
ncbi:MAG TPA: permease prefix domain 1-containing protein [Kofleriaceae bacterium]